MRRRLFTPHILPLDLPKEVRKAIVKEMWRQARHRPSFWAMLLALMVLTSVLSPLITRCTARFGDNMVSLALIAEMVLVFALVILLNNCFHDDIRRSAWLAHGVCPDCRYNLTGNASGTCPECGANCPAMPAETHARGSRD